MLLVLLTTPVAAAAQVEPEPAPDPYLTAAVASLGEQDYELGLRLLKKAARRGSDPRVTYYTAFALEKLGRCDQARRTYEDAVFAGPPRFTAAANAALEGFDTRCAQVATRTQSPPEAAVDTRMPRRSNTLATVGWVLTTVGGLVLVGVPVKMAFDREIATQTEQYFEQVYECDVDSGELGADCDDEAVKSNPQWKPYDQRIRNARRSNVWMIVTGSALLIGGITSVVIGSSRPTVMVAPIHGGAAIVWSTSF